MRRIYFPFIPAFIATVTLTLGSAPVGAQQNHDHGAAAGAAAGCACCQNSGGAAANSAAAQPSAPSADVMEGDPVNPAAPGAMAAAGGCAGMAMKQGAAAAKAPGAGCGSCPMMAAKAAPPAEDHSNHGAAPDPSSFAMPGKAGCGAMNSAPSTATTDPFAEDISVGE